MTARTTTRKPSRWLQLASACATTFFMLSGVAHAADAWPSRQVRIIVPFTPGGTSDNLGRLVAQKLTETYKQPFVVENRPGAGGVLGSDMVAKSAPDGYTLVVSGVASHAIAPLLSKKFPYNPVTDFSHIALFGGPPNVIAVHPDVPARDLKQFIAYAKAQRDAVSYGSPGNGTMGHLFAKAFEQRVGIQMAHIPYKGASQAVADVMAGHITALSNTLTSAGGQIRTGKLRALGVSSTTRVPDFPDVPTFAEMGYPELTAVIWFSLSGPAGMPQDVVQKLNVEVRRILKLPDVREKLRLEGIEPGDLDQAAFASFVASEGKRWAPVVKASGAQID